MSTEFLCAMLASFSQLLALQITLLLPYETTQENLQRDKKCVLRDALLVSSPCLML